MKYKFFPCSVGVRCDGSGRYAIASINSRGQKRLRTNSARNNFFYSKIPFLRGLLFFIYGMIALFTTFDEVVIDDITLTEKEEKKKRVKIFWGALIAGIGAIVWLVILGYLPAKLSFLILGYSSMPFVRNLLIAFLKVVMLLLLLLLLRLIPAMVELYKFNGACNIMSASHDKKRLNKSDGLHQPLNFLNFAVFSFIFSCFVITLVGISVGVVLNWLINLGIFIVCVSISYEILKLLEKSEKLIKFCMATSLFVVSKPNTTHLELARSALIELASGRELKGNMKDNEIALSLVKSEMESKLSKAGKIEESDIDWIIATVLKKNRAEIKLVRCVSEREYREIMKATEERAMGKPLSAIFGFVEFYGLRFSVNKKVLSPRMETELLVEAVINEAKNIKKCKVLDVGTGSGAIAVSIAKFSQAEVSAIDISKGALDVAKENALAHDVKVTFIQSDLFSQLKKKQKYDIIVSNPPYIRTLDIEGLDGEVKNYDPRIALDGGDDGLDFYRRIIEDAPAHLNKNGQLFFELGKGQFTEVKSLLSKAGFSDIKGIKDYNKIYRIVKAVWKK